MANKLLINEPALQVLPSLATVLGVEKAIILQQLHFLIESGNNGRRLADGRVYIWNTLDSWVDDVFPFWTRDQLRRYLEAMVADGLIEKAKPFASTHNQTCFYTINQDKLLVYQQLADFAREQRRERRLASTPINTDLANSPNAFGVQANSDLANSPNDTQRKHKENNTHISARTRENKTADFDYPLSKLYEAFPELELTPHQCGLIEAEVTIKDAEAWRRTLRQYRENFDPDRKQYLPWKVGNLLNVFRRHREDVSKEKPLPKNGHRLPTLEERRAEYAEAENTVIAPPPSATAAN